VIKLPCAEKRDHINLKGVETMGRRRSEINTLQIPRAVSYVFTESEIDFLNLL